MFARLLTMAAAFAALLIPAILVVERLDADTLQLVLVVASTFALGAAGVLMMLEGIRALRRGRRGEAPLPGRPAPPARQAAPAQYGAPTRPAVPTRAPEKDTSARKPIGAVVVEGFASRLAFGLLSFALPLYAHSLGMTVAEIGLLLSTNMAVAVVLKPAMGALIDRIGVRTAYVAAVLLRTAVLVTLVLASGPAHLFLARGLHGVSIALRDPASSTVLSALGGKKAIAQRFAWFQTVKSVAGSVGQFSAGVMLSILIGNYTAVFTLAALLSALPLVAVLAGLRGPVVDGLRLPRPERGTPMPADLRRALLPYAGLGALMTGTAYLMANLLPVLAVEYMGLAPAAAASMYLVKSVVSLTGPLWGWIADRVSVRLVLGVRALGNALSSLIWLVFPNYPGLIAGRVADDLGKAAFSPAWGSVMARVSAMDPPRRSRTLALLSSAEDAGEMAGPVVAGVIWTTFGLPALLIFRAVAAVGTEVYALVVSRRFDTAAQETATDAAPVVPSSPVDCVVKFPH
nr:MFS transporter [Actinomycetales bacterium]